MPNDNRYIRPTVAPEIVEQRLELISYYLQRAQEWADSFNLRITVNHCGRPVTVHKGTLNVARWQSSRPTKNQTQA